MAPCNGTQQWHHVHVVTLSPNHSTLQWHPTMAQQWHHVLCTLQWHPGATSNPPKWFVALPPPIGSKKPYSHHYLGNKNKLLEWSCFSVAWGRAPVSLAHVIFSIQCSNAFSKTYTKCCWNLICVFIYICMTWWKKDNTYTNASTPSWINGHMHVQIQSTTYTYTYT